MRVKLAINPDSIYSVVSLNLPIEVDSIIRPFAALFSKRVWCQTQVLVVGAILATGKRTVTSILGVMGLTQEKHFHALSSCIESCGVVKLGSQPHFNNDVSNYRGTGWTNCHGDGRHN